MKRYLTTLLVIVFCTSCAEDPLPKPSAFLALEYPESKYKTIHIDCPYEFQINELATIVDARGSNKCWINIKYKALDGTIFITYQPVTNNLDSLLRDAQNLPLQHTIKADVIEGDIYTNEFHDTYGMFYEIAGDAASQAQFYLTDSLQHFITGSIYFETQPNFDSILPAAEHLKQDMRHLMESLSWKSKG